MFQRKGGGGFLNRLCKGKGGQRNVRLLWLVKGCRKKGTAECWFVFKGLQICPLGIHLQTSLNNFLQF